MIGDRSKRRRTGFTMNHPLLSFSRRCSSAGETGCFRPETMPTASDLVPGAGGNEEAPSRTWGHNSGQDGSPGSRRLVGFLPAGGFFMQRLGKANR